MSTAMNVIKIIGAWGCLIGAVALMIFTPAGASGLPLALGILSIAFSQLPVSA